MKRNPIALVLLFPFSLIYAGVISMRNIFYETGLLKSTSFSIPVINVGNLSVGGTGKTPHIEYLIRLLSPYINVATLSRGYKRKSKGFLLVQNKHNAKAAGDEPLQFKRKFPNIPVAVSESRNIGIPMLLKHNPHINTVLLDDAFQHRSVIPGLNILLTEHNNLFVDDYLLPAGRLREPKQSYKRANIIIVTKCPEDLSKEQQTEIIERIQPTKNQQVLFSKYQYEQPYYIFDRNISIELQAENKIILISAVAKVDYLLDYLDRTAEVENVIKYEDHHYFSDLELEQFKKIYENNSGENTLFLTTEKDAMRLELHKAFLLENNIPIFVLPVKVAFFDDQNLEFDAHVKEFLTSFKV